MGYLPPQNIPVPFVTVEQIGLRLGIWAVGVEVINLFQVAIFAKPAGAQDFIAISGGVVLNTPEDVKVMVETQYGGDEMAWFKAKILAPLNKQLDEYLQQNYDWEKNGAPVLLPSDQEIDAMSSEVAQVNFKLAKYATFQVDEAKKTVNLVTLV